MHQNDFERIYDSIPEFVDLTIPFVVVEINFAVITEINSLGYSLKKLAQSLINCSNLELESKVFLAPNEIAAYSYLVGLKNTYNQLAKSPGDRAMMVSIMQNNKFIGTSIRAGIDKQIFVDSLNSLLCED